MSISNPDFTAVLAVYSGNWQIQTVEASPSVGGFSGSGLWRLETARGPLCLRRWPAEYPDSAQLTWIHHVLATVGSAGVSQIPLPISTLQGETYVEQGNRLWELTPWLPGKADQPEALEQESPAARISAAMKVLAEFHRAAGHPLIQRKPGEPAWGRAPGLTRRAEQLSKLLKGGIDELEGRTKSHRPQWPDLAERAKLLFNGFRRVAGKVAETLRAALNVQVQIQPCIRDIHREHVLFSDDVVTGIVDFGSMNPDSVACDIARLLGSMALDDAPRWQAGLREYQQTHAFSEVEQVLVSVYDQTAVLLSGVNWLQWVFCDFRQFNNRNGVLRRFDVILKRLSNLTENAAWELPSKSAKIFLPAPSE